MTLSAQVPVAANDLYDAVQLYADTVQRIIDNGGDRTNYTDGRTFFDYVKNTPYESE